MPRFPLIVSLTAALMTSACVSTPDLGARPQLKSVPAQATFAGPTADWPSTDWWRAYGDTQLDRLIAEGLKDSPTIAAADARLRRAEALVTQAGAAGLPAISANGSAAESRSSLNTGLPVPSALRGWNDSARASLDFNWELDFWGKTRAAVAAATSEADASRADAAAARLVISTAIAASYADLARLYADRDVLASSVKVREETLGLVRRRVASGYDSNAELRQAEAGPPSARADLKATDEAIALTRLRLAALMGAAPDRAAAIDRPADPALKSFGLPAQIPAYLVGRRPDLVAARWRADAASDRIDVAHAAFYPNVNLVGLIGLQSLGIGNLADAGSGIGSAGVAVNLPIFDAGRRKAGYRVARADFDAAVAAYDGALNNALEEVADAVTSQRALYGRLADTREAYVAAHEGWRLARRRYDAGASDYQSVLLAEDRMLGVQRAVAGLESRRFILDLALVRALGGGYGEAAPATAD